MKYVVHDNDGNILKWGMCSRTAFSQLGENAEEVTELFPEMDITHKMKAGKIKAKDISEIVRNPKTKQKTSAHQKARITNKQYRSILDRLDKLEKGE